MRVIVSDDAMLRIRLTAKYIRKEFGKNSRDKFMQDVRQIRRLLAENPNLGPVEPLLANLPQTYRSFVLDRLNKIVYRIDEDVITIVDFWDVRRDPASLTKGLD